MDEGKYALIKETKQKKGLKKTNIYTYMKGKG